jgi:hypothetical protein
MNSDEDENKIMKKLVDDSDQEMENQNDSKDSDLISDV